MILSLIKDSEGLSEAERELRNLKEQLNEDFPVGPLIRKCCTLDQVSYLNCKSWHLFFQLFSEYVIRSHLLDYVELTPG